MSAPYPPGQPQWPENRPRRPPPIQFRPDAPKPQGSTALAWSLRIAGLVAVAVISGLVWWYINNDEPPAASGTGDETTQQGGGAYNFTAHEKVPEPQTEDTCAEHSYEDVQDFFHNGECERLTRALYVTKVNGRTVYTSVSVVRMHDESAAADLRVLTDQNGTGNVNDLVRDGVVVIDGLKSLSKGYASKQRGRDVVIVESAFAPRDEGDKAKDKKLLDQVSDDALPLGNKISGNAG